MLNVKTLTDTMSRMPLPQLQQYAALHKNDPYIVTLALSIANQKKQMQASQAGQAGMMPQPKVVDQDIAQITSRPQPQMLPQQMPPQQTAAAPQQQLPEDQGIGQLPAQNMQNMAGGGIVAFDDGGSVPGFAGPTGSYVDPAKYVRSTTGGKDWFLDLPDTIQDPTVPYYKLIPNPLASAVSGKTFNSRQEAIDAANAASGIRSTAPATAPALPPSAMQMMSGVQPTTLPTSAPAPVAGTPTASALPSTAKLVNPVAPTNAGLAALNTKPLTPEQAAAAGKQFGDESALTSGIEQLRSDTQKNNEDIQKAYEQGRAALPKPGEEAEARLKAREAQDAIGQADAKALAIFKAGLGMMAGTSPHAFENIGKGAMAGLEDYSSSIKEFRKLGIERDKAYAEIEAARNAAARDDLKTSVGLQEKATDRLTRVNEKGIDITATLFKTNTETAANIWRDSNDQAQANARTMATETGATNRALIQERGANARTAAGLPSTLYSQLGAAQEGSPLLKGYNIAKNEGSMERLFESYNKLANDPLNGTYFKAQHPTFESYVRTYQSGIGAGSGSGFVNQLPANAPVLKPK